MKKKQIVKGIENDRFQIVISLFEKASIATKYTKLLSLEMIRNSM